MESVTIGKRRWFGLGGRRVTVEEWPDPAPPPGVTITHGRAGLHPSEQVGTVDVQLTAAELNTIVLALKFGRIRYGMLLQLSEQRGGAVLSWDALGDLKDSLDDALGQKAA
ncbi:hypothetical protein [Sphingomonas sp.]|uniref:hypothetical protein n=1 Tax=Sphingomonas sp. TaxID=28214 RepID=UPI0038A5F1D0